MGSLEVEEGVNRWTIVNRHPTTYQKRRRARGESGGLGRWTILSSAGRKAATIAVDERLVEEVAVDIIILIPDDLKMGKPPVNISPNNESFSQNQNPIDWSIPDLAYRRSRNFAAGCSTESLPQLFGRIVAVGGRVARVLVCLCCGFASVAPFAFEDIGALGAAITAKIAVYAVSVNNVLAVLMRMSRSAMNEWMKIDKD